MEGKHRLILRDCRSNIVNDLEPNDILPDLGSVLTPKDDAKIKAQSTRQGRCEQLLEILPRKGPNAFKVFVEALKREVPHLADALIEADKGIVRKKSATLREENCESKTKLEAAKQDHAKTSLELEELKRLHETFKTETSQQIKKLAEIVQQLIDDSCSPREALRNLRGFTERETQIFGMEIQNLTKRIAEMIRVNQRRYQSLQKEHGNLSQELKDVRGKNKRLLVESENRQRHLEKTEQDLANKKKVVKDYQQKLQEEKKDTDELRKNLKNVKQQVREENKSHRKKLSAERTRFNALKKEAHELRKQMPGRIYNYSKDFDQRGVVYYLATNYGKTSQVNPSSTQIVATRSSDGEGKAEDILKNQVKSGTVSGTQEKEGSWWRVDLTKKYALYLTHYTLRHGRNKDISVLVNWRLEGSLDGLKWTALKNHKDDCGLKERDPDYTCTWTIDGNPNAFRYFRILQTGKNSSKKFGIFLSGIELYGVLITKSS